MATVWTEIVPGTATSWSALNADRLEDEATLHLKPELLPVFNRASVAYKSGGTQVAANIMRRELGHKNEINGSIMSEEGATNLFAVNQASVETDLTGFVSAGNHVISRITSDATHGSACGEIVATAGGGSGNNIGLPSLGIVNGTQYMLSFDAKSISGNTSLHMEFWGSIGAVNHTLTTEWQRFSVLLTASTLDTLYFWLQGAGTCRIDRLQIEQRVYSTSWHYPVDGARANELLYFPTAGVLNAAEGTIAIWVNVNAASKRQIVEEGPRLIDCTGLTMFHNNNSAQWGISIATTNYVYASDTYTPNGWHQFVFVWSQSGSFIKLYIDGILRATGVHAVPTLDANMYIGCRLGTAHWLNAAGIDDLQTWNRALSGAEIAGLYSVMA